MLETLEKTAGRKSLAEGALEAVEVSSCAQAQLVFVVGLNFSEFLDKSRMIDIQSPEAREGFCSFGLFASLDTVPRCFGQDQHSSDEDETPSELDGNWDTVRASVITILGRVVDDGSNEETDSNGKLVASDNCTSNPFRCRLGLVQGNES